MKANTLRSVLLLIAATLLAVSSGCTDGPSNYEQLGIAEVSGRVTLDGKPLSNARVIFVEPGAGFSSVGDTDSDGKYTLMLNTTQSGVAPGEKVVRITTAFSDEEDGPRQTESIPVRYNKESELTASVKPSESQTFNFDLQSNGNVEQPKTE